MYAFGNKWFERKRNNIRNRQLLALSFSIWHFRRVLELENRKRKLFEISLHRASSPRAI